MSRPCPGRINADKVEAAVWVWLGEALTKPEALLLQIAGDSAINTVQRVRLEKELAAAEQRRAGYEARLDTLLHKHLLGDVDGAAYARVQAELVEARENTAKEAEHLRRELEAASRFQLSRQAIVEYCTKAWFDLLRLGILDSPEHFAKRQQHVRAFLTAVWVMPDGTIELKGILPQVRPDQMPILAAPPPLSTVLQTPGCSKHNWTHDDQAAGLPFSVILAA